MRARRGRSHGRRHLPANLTADRDLLTCDAPDWHVEMDLPSPDDA